MYSPVILCLSPFSSYEHKIYVLLTLCSQHPYHSPDGRRTFVSQIRQRSTSLQKSQATLHSRWAHKEQMNEPILGILSGLGLWDCTQDIHLIHMDTNSTTHHNQAGHTPTSQDQPQPEGRATGRQERKAVKDGNCNNNDFKRMIMIM